MKHQFTNIIEEILKRHFAEDSTDIFDKSQLLQYINIKTKSANSGSKARGSFANLYAIYVLVEDYITKGFDDEDGGNSKDYSKYEGAEFTELFERQRELPFGAKLQNHALNNRLNAEFKKFFPTSEYTPIIRDLGTKKYWINENLIKIKIANKTYNISKTIIEIIDEYTKTKKGAFEKFIQNCLDLKEIQGKEPKEVECFILSLLAPEVDARLFEIVSYSILKYFYHEQQIYWGFEIDKLQKENLMLFKTGRTNANDGGIDFVMKPLGRFFQVTETLDVKKYFLDIDKIQRYPITFIIKSKDTVENLIDGIRKNAYMIYSVKKVVDRYMQCIEEIINIPKLNKYFLKTIKQGYLKNILDEIILQSKVEFNYQDDEYSEEY